MIIKPGKNAGAIRIENKTRNLTNPVMYIDHSPCKIPAEIIASAEISVQNTECT